MKVLFLSKSFPIHGGVERWLDDLCSGLGDYGVEPVLALAKGLRFHLPARYLEAHPDLADVPTYEIDGMSGIEAGRRLSAEKIITAVEPAVVVPVLLYDALAAAVARRLRGQSLRIVFPIHDNGISIFRAIEEYQTHLDMVVSVNRLFLDVLQIDLAWPRSRATHIRCAARPQQASRIIARDVTLRIGYSGRLTQQQKRVFDLVDLCQALARLEQPYRLSIAGTGAQQGELEERLSGEIACGQVEFLGQLNHEELYGSFYPNLDTLVIASDWESGPIVAWEAMMHGVVPVTSNYRGLRREGLLRHGWNSMVYPIGDMACAASKLKKLALDGGFLTKLAANAKQSAGNHLTVESMVSSWSEVFSRACEIPPRSPSPPPPGAAPWNRRATWGLPPLVAHRLRGFLGRGYHCSNSNAEWPRYTLRRASSQARESFDQRVREIEDRVSTGQPDH